MKPDINARIRNISRKELKEGISPFILKGLLDYGQAASDEEFEHMVESTAERLLSKYGSFNWGKVRYVFEMGAEGKYGKAYKLTQAVINSWLDEYSKEKAEAELRAVSKMKRDKNEPSVIPLSETTACAIAFRYRRDNPHLFNFATEEESIASFKETVRQVKAGEIK